MMTIFDYIFYRAFRYYSRKEKGAEFTAMLILSLYQLLFFVCVFGTFFFFFPVIYVPKEYFAILAFLFIGINYRIYHVNFSVEKYESRWGDETKKQRIQRGMFFWGGLFLMILYIIFMGAIPKDLPSN